MRKRRRDPTHNKCDHRRRRCRLLLLVVLAGLMALGLASSAQATLSSGLRFEPETNSYSGLTFSFDPRLDKRLETLHFDSWLEIMQHSSRLLYEALNGRAHLAEVRVLIPYRWRQLNWPLMHKPGVPIIANRRLLFTDSDVIVGFEDPVYKETPFAIQHDECAKQGLYIHMPVSFLEQEHPTEAKLKARLLVREFASHRYGIFKESGFRSDPMYPAFSALAGAGRRAHNRTVMGVPAVATNGTGEWEHWLAGAAVRGFDEHWAECAFETQPASGLPTSQAAHCAPYLARATEAKQGEWASPGTSFNLMSEDPFAHSELATRAASRPLQWRELADSVKWHFCGENFPPPAEPAGEPRAAATPAAVPAGRAQSFAHNPLAKNKQNVMCAERSAMEVIRASEDFTRTTLSASTFNRLPATTFRFMQEMPPRLILCVEYGAHLFQSRRLEHGILEAALAKLLAYDLIPDTELALVLFSQNHLHRNHFKRLDSSVDSRFTLFSPPIDPFDEPARIYTDQELAQLDIQTSGAIVKGSCSFAKVMAEASVTLQQRSQYDDVGADIIMITSGLFIEDEAKIEEIIKSLTYRADNLNLNIIIYPSTMLFDTKTRDGYVVLNPSESEAIVRSRLNKLLLIQRLTNAKIHFVKEHLDANGAVKMSTLVQFYQIFEHISKGHSWDQTHSMVMLNQESVDSRGLQPNGTRLTFQFELDSSIQNELIVGFIDLKKQQARSGKRFAIKSLQLRSPGGHLFLTDSHPWPDHQFEREQADQPQDSSGTPILPGHESTLFQYRTQLSLAGFHLKPAHLTQLNVSNGLVGVWTLSAISEEPLQTNGLAMARVNPVGDTIVARCWIQTYYHEDQLDASPRSYSGQQVKSVKVFVQTKAGAQMGPVQEVHARMEVQDRVGNIVQNVNMLDDGLGAPDMTRGDGIHSQYVQRAQRPGFYKVTVELSGHSDMRPPRDLSVGRTDKSQDHPCCGSFVPQNPSAQPDTRYLSRQLYCGSFYLDPTNRLGHQRPPRINNLTVVNVDQDNRRIRIRWYEPQVDISGSPIYTSKQSILADNELQPVDDTAASDSASTPTDSMMALASGLQHINEKLKAGHEDDESDEQKDVEMAFDSSSGQHLKQTSPRAIIMAHHSSTDQPVNRYEIKLFSDRDAIKRSFDAKQEVGFRFNEWNSEGAFPNASAFGGMKEVTLRIPYGREGIYYIALKVYNNIGLGSPMSNIIEFWMRNNVSAEEADSIYGQSSTDAEGNVYDKNGELIHRASGQLNYSLLRGPVSLDGISILVFISLVAFIFSIVCISLVACLASSAKRSLATRQSKAEDKKAVAGMKIAGNGSGSSMVSSGCGSSQQSEVASSAGGSQGGHDVDINKLSLADEQNFSHNPQHIISDQHNHTLTDAGGLHHQQQLTSYSLPQHHQHYPPEHPTQWLQHTLVNGYAYATINNANTVEGPKNTMSPVQSWPVDILLSHYDKVKQARERNEAPPVMRIETLEHQDQLNEGLPNADEHLVNEQSYLARKQRNQAPPYFNQQLQQQLNSVLKHKHRALDDSPCADSTPALEGVAELPEFEANGYQQQIAPPLPPHYLYCTPSDESGLVSQTRSMTQEPTIYSQVTNLQQVSSNDYYANQWPQGVPNPNQTIYSLQADHYQQQQQSRPSENYVALDKSSSAISEV